jgi:hypothetical protein
MFKEKPLTMEEFIICAAIQIVETGKIYYGHRHPHCIEALNGELSWTLNRQQIAKVEKIQGFITNKKRFVGREEALVIALANNQVLDIAEVRGKKLHSEDIY